MKKSLVICLSLFLTVNSYSQQLSEASQRVFKSVENMQSVINLNKISQTGITFDTRYEGVKGSPRLTDTLLPSFLKLSGQDYYFQIKADLDLVNNSLIYAGSGSGQIYSIPSSDISELIINQDGHELLFRTTKGEKFEKDLKETQFYQVLSEGEYEFIKIPIKGFLRADYQGAYTADRRYDEYVNEAKYYLKGRDGTYCQVQMNKKSLIKLIPEKKEIIEQAFSKNSSDDKESLVMSILEQK
ncbi:MAG: hypothetical protein JXR67_09985 [Bacteroidales bacterium]|nr:hypothetical protein [Bacteroidales bacterium]